MEGMKLGFAIVLTGSLAASTSRADDALVLDEGAQLERTHRTENAIAAGVTAAVLGYESVQLFRMAVNTEPGGGWVDFSGLTKGVGYTLGTLTAVGSISMIGLAVHDISATPVEDARDAYAAGDHTAAWQLGDRGLNAKQRGMRAVAWLNLVVDTGLVAYGMTTLAAGSEKDHDAAIADLWVGGTGMLVATTALLHLREPVAARTHRRLAVAPAPGGITVAGTF
jgi:hypothetical protein